MCNVRISIAKKETRFASPNLADVAMCLKNGSGSRSKEGPFHPAEAGTRQCSARDIWTKVEVGLKILQLKVEESGHTH